MNVNQYVIATLRRQRIIFSAAVAGAEDVDADVDCDDIMMMTTKWLYSWVQSEGSVTTESIVRFDTWFELFEVVIKI